MIFEESVEEVGNYLEWKSQFVAELPSQNDVRMERKVFFKKAIVIKINEQDHDFYTFSEDIERIFQ